MTARPRPWPRRSGSVHTACTDPIRRGRPAITSDSSMTPAWPTTRLPARRTKGVETAVHAKPRCSARAMARGRAGHTRPNSPASSRSTGADDIGAL